MAKKSRRLIFAALEDEENPKVANQCINAMDTLRETEDEKSHSTTVLANEIGDNEQSFYGRRSDNKKRRKDRRIIEDPNEKQLLESIVFGEGFTGGSDSEGKAGNEDEDYDDINGVQLVRSANSKIQATKIEENDIKLVEVKIEDDSITENEPNINPLIFEYAEKFPCRTVADADEESTTEESEKENEKRVWVDSDDDQNVVDLESNPKFRRLVNSDKLSNDGRRSLVLDAKTYRKKLKVEYDKKLKSSGERWAELLRQKKRKVEFNNATDHSGCKSGTNSDDDYDEESRMITNFISSSAPVLAKNKFGLNSITGSKILYKMLPDANQQDPSNCKLKISGFIPNTPQDILYTAGKDKSLRLFKIDGDRNHKLVSIHIKNTPIRSAAAINNQRPSVYILTEHKTLSYLDVETNKLFGWRAFGSKTLKQFRRIVVPSSTYNNASITGDFAISTDSGAVLLCDTRSCSLVRSYKMNAIGDPIAFNARDENYMFTGDREGMIYIWDLRSSRCLEKYQDEGSTAVTALASGCAAHLSTSPCYLASGSKSGFVNIYNLSDYNHPLEKRVTSFLDTVNDGTADSDVTNEDFIDKGYSQLHFKNDFLGEDVITTPIEDVKITPTFGINRSPIKSFGNLTTVINDISFHPTCSLMAMSTNLQKEGVKLAHIPSFSVYSNFPNPTGQLRLRYPNSVSFNNSGYLMAIANDLGQVKLVALKQFVKQFVPHY